MADLDGPLDGQRRPADRAALALLNEPEVEPAVHRDVALDVDAAQVEVVLVGAGHHVGAALERRIGDDGHPGDADGAETAGVGAEQLFDLFRVRRADVLGTEAVDQLLLHQFVVATQQNQGG